MESSSSSSLAQSAFLDFPSSLDGNNEKLSSFIPVPSTKTRGLDGVMHWVRSFCHPDKKQASVGYVARFQMVTLVDEKLEQIQKGILLASTTLVSLEEELSRELSEWLSFKRAGNCFSSCQVLKSKKEVMELVKHSLEGVIVSLDGMEKSSSEVFLCEIIAKTMLNGLEKRLDEVAQGIFLFEEFLKKQNLDTVAEGSHEPYCSEPE